MAYKKKTKLIPSLARSGWWLMPTLSRSHGNLNHAATPNIFIMMISTPKRTRMVSWRAQTPLQGPFGFMFTTSATVFRRHGSWWLIYVPPCLNKVRRTGVIRTPATHVLLVVSLYKLKLRIC
ncbi:hypothetical protein R6Q59_020982 [Mikania micrantha]